MNDDYMDVSDLDNAYRDAEVLDFEKVPDGTYQAMVHTVQFKWIKSKPPERAFEWTFKVISGQMRGARIWKTSLLRDDLLRFLKTDVSRFGLKINTLSELQSRLSELLDCIAEIKVETKKDREGKERTNVYINRMITSDDAPKQNGGSEPPPHNDADIPF